MGCLQVWLPLFGRSLGFAEAARDMQRALERWDCDHRIWILPELEKPLIRWQEPSPAGPRRMCAIPGEALERIEIYHIGQNGYAYGTPEDESFPNRRTDGLLDAWLGWVNAADFQWDPPRQITLDVPEVVGQEIRYRRREYIGPTLPVQNVGVPLRDPSRVNGAILTDADAAAAHKVRYGELNVIEREDSPPVIVSEKDPSFRALPGVLRPPEPLQGLFPLGMTIDALAACNAMSRIVRQALTDPQPALQRAQAKAAPYLSAGTSTRALTWFMPTFIEVGDMRTVIQRGASLGLVDVREFPDLKFSDMWRKQMTEHVPVRRVWGPIGLFWALLIERLEASQPLQVCELCGRTIQGKRGKRMCGREDDLECFRKRRTRDRSRERLRAQTERKSRPPRPRGHT